VRIATLRETSPCRCINLIFLLCGVFLLLALPAEAKCVVTFLAVLHCTLSYASFAKRFSHLAPYCFGALISLLPLTDSGSLLALSYLILASYPLQRSALRRALPLALLVLAAPLARILMELDTGSLIAAGIEQGGSFSLSSLLWRGIADAHFRWIVDTQMALRWLIIPVIIATLSGAQNITLRNKITLGASIGGVIAATIIVAEWAGLLSRASFGDSTTLWISLHRISGTFTDPNSAGLALFLIVGLVVARFSRWSLLKIVALAIICSAGLLVGSRSFLLGTVILAVYGIYRVIKNSDQRTALTHHTLLRALAIVLLSTAVLTLAIRNRESLPSLNRAINTVTLDTMQEALFSRSLFARISLIMLSEQPWFGIGFERYRDRVVPITMKLGSGTGEWSDNPNNFYFQLLVEFGIFGTLLWYLTLRRYRWIEQGPYKAVFIIFLALLFLGPHIDFDEVALLIGLVAAYVVEGDDSHSNSMLSLLTIPIVALSFVFTLFSQHGFYGVERDTRGYFSWSGGRGSGIILCRSSGAAVLRIHLAPLPYKREMPEITIVTASETITPKLEPGKDTAVRLYCGTSSIGQSLWYRYYLTGEWTPRSLTQGNDGRVLGIQMRM
jgi:hypothetical protein